MVVDEEALSAVTSAPELPHNKTRGLQKNDSRAKNSLELILALRVRMENRFLFTALTLLD